MGWVKVYVNMGNCLSGHGKCVHVHGNRQHGHGKSIWTL
jgi:hypothetical protein